jgi:ABC-type Mn2+/Zn2+ transport system permease subunit
MALGAILLSIASRHQRASGVSWESVLFGNLLAVGWPDAFISIAVAAGVIAALIFFRRPLTLWAFDPQFAESIGIRGSLCRVLLLTLLAVVTVTAMKLAGVVLATAMLVLPGAAALALSQRSRPVLIASMLWAILGVIAGLVLSFETDWPPGPSIVLAQCAIYFVCRLIGR